MHGPAGGMADAAAGQSPAHDANHEPELMVGGDLQASGSSAHPSGMTIAYFIPEL